MTHMQNSSLSMASWNRTGLQADEKTSDTMKRSFVSDGRLDSIIAERVVYKSRVPAGAIPRGVNFVLGGLAGMTSVMFVHPFDLVKNRMQLSGQGGIGRVYNTSIHTAVSVISNEGAFAVYKGLSAALLRQAVYGSIRLGAYQNIVDNYTSNHGVPPSFGMKLLMGMLSGGVAAAVSTPTDLALVRMMADGRQPLWRQRGYTSVLNALFRIVKEEGVSQLWRGCTPTVMRAMIVNAVEQGTYRQCKDYLLATDYFDDTIRCHVVASLVSGLFSTTVSLPVDICKTRIQQSATNRNVIDAFSQLISKEGLKSMWKGFTPYYIRMGPHTVFIFVFLEQYRYLYFYTFR